LCPDGVIIHRRMLGNILCVVDKKLYALQITPVSSITLHVNGYSDQLLSLLRQVFLILDRINKFMYLRTYRLSWCLN